jgi:hypothetical protein
MMQFTFPLQINGDTYENVNKELKKTEARNLSPVYKLLCNCK